MYLPFVAASETESLPSRECGLKYTGMLIPEPEQQSLPSRECGLKSSEGQ